MPNPLTLRVLIGTTDTRLSSIGLETADGLRLLTPPLTFDAAANITHQIAALLALVDALALSGHTIHGRERLAELLAAR